MKKNKPENYWEQEEGEQIEFDRYFMRCFDKAGKLQFGTKYYDPASGKPKYKTQFVLDRDALINSKEGAEFLMQTIDDWRNEDE